MTEVLRVALAYAAAGWPVFPTRPDDPSCPGGPRCACKAPLTARGFKDATTDLAVIRGWWGKWPANLAIATGAPGPDVLDVDVREDGAGWAAFSQLKRAGLLTGAQQLVRTPSGGVHLYFGGTPQAGGRLPRHHLDFKASGGYVLAPPSQVHGRRYELLDHRTENVALYWQAVRCLLEPPRPAAPPRPRGHGSADALAAWVARLAEGNRNAGLYWAACRAAESGQDIAVLVAAAMEAGLSQEEARRTVASAGRRTAR